MNEIPGFIQWVHSRHANREFPVLVFSGDVDFATSGMVALTSADRHEVVAIMATSDEWNLYQLPVIQERVNRDLGRSDLRCVDLLRLEKSRPVYADVLFAGGEGVGTRTQTLKAFVESGGIVTRHGFDA